MSKKTKKSILFPGILLFLLVCACLLYAHFLLQRPSVQRFLITKLSAAAGYEVKATSFHVSFWRGLSISAYGLSASSRDQKEHISASVVRIGFAGRSLLKGHFVPASVNLDHPVIEISAPLENNGHRASLGEILSHAGLLKLAAIPSLSITDGQVRIKGSPFSLHALFLKLNRKNKEKPGQAFQIKSALEYRGQEIPIKLQGRLRGMETGEKVSAAISGEALQVPASWIPWPRFVPFSGGTFDVTFNGAGSSTGSLSMKGTMLGHNLRFSICRRDRRKAYDLSSLSLRFTASLDKKNITIHIPEAHLLDTSLSARISSEPGAPSPRFALSIRSPYMPLSTFKTLFPTSLVPGWIGKSLFPRLSGGEVRTDHFSLVGTLDEISHLNRPENMHTLSMTVTWQNLTVGEQGAPLPFEVVAGQMNIRGNRLGLSRLTGRFGSSTVQEASMEVEPLIGGRRVYSIDLGGHFLLQDLTPMRQLPWTPADLKKMLAGIEGSSGPMTARLELLKKGDTGLLRLRKGVGTFKDCVIVDKTLLFPVRVEKGEVRIGEAGQMTFEGSGFWGRSPLETSGTVDLARKQLKAKVDGNLDLDALLERVLPKKTWTMHFGKPVALTIYVSRQKSSWSSTGMINLKKAPVLKAGFLHLHPLSKKGDICFDVGYVPGKSLEFRSVDGRFGRSLFSASGRITLSGKRSILANVRIPEFFLKNLGIQFQKGCMAVAGSIAGAIRANIPLNNPLSATLTGKVEAKDLSLGVSGLSHPITAGHFKVLFSGKKLRFESLGFKTGRSSIEILGDLTQWAGLRGDLTLKSAALYVADFHRKKSGSSRKTRSVLLQYLLEHSRHLLVSLQVSRIYWRETAWGPLTGQCVFEKDAFHLSNGRLKMAHGIVTLKGDFEGNKGRKIAFLSHVRFYQQPVQELFRIFKVRNYYLEGQMSADLLLSGEGHDKNSLLAGLHGKGKVLVEKGKIKKSNVLIDILNFLSIQKIFRRPPPNLSKEGFYFDKIGSDFVIKQGVLRTENLLMKSPVFNAAGKGRLNFLNKQMRADLGIQPLVTLDSLVSKIPIIGYILTGKDKSLLVYYFKVEGPLSAPKVTYVPLKKWGNSIMGYVTRIFLTLPRLFEKLMKLRKPSSPFY